MSGKGKLKKKMAMKAAVAMPTITLLVSTRRPMRMTASTTTAMTAGFSPKNSPCTSVIS